MEAELRGEAAEPPFHYRHWPPVGGSHETCRRPEEKLSGGFERSKISSHRNGFSEVFGTFRPDCFWLTTSCVSQPKQHPLPAVKKQETNPLPLFMAVCRCRKDSVPFPHSMLRQSPVDSFHRFLSVTKEHIGIVVKEERVLHASVTSTHRALGNNNLFSFPNMHNRHTSNRRIRLG